MARHILKTDHSLFQESWDENKNFEVRLDDRNFQVGDNLVLVETVNSSEEMKKGKSLEYTGRFLEIDVTYKLSSKCCLQDGWCILGTRLNYGEEYLPESSEFEHLLNSSCS